MKNILLTLTLLVAAMGAVLASEPVVANSIEELIPLLSEDNANVLLKKGSYRITLDDVADGELTKVIEIREGRPSHALFFVEGNNSVIDFGGSTVEVETPVFNSRKDHQFVELHVVGSGNVVKNLKLVDVGEAQDFPRWGCLNMVIDGAHNRVERIDIMAKGSFPYGYGELFGKGAGPTIKHFKHSACLVRGESAHVKNCRIINHSYGHCLFMQAANNPLIEGCYIEGELSTTNAVLAEEGTGSRADAIDFKTVWGYRVPENYTLSLCEAGIRVYNTGFTIIDGERFSRGTSNVTVRDCYVKNVRAGVTLTHTKGTRVVENTTTIGCERGFAVGTGGKIINCYSDLQYGPAFGVDYERDSNIEVDITLLPDSGAEELCGNATRHAAYIIGHNHNITLRKGSGFGVPGQELLIEVGGDSRTLGALDKVDIKSASDITIVNQTDLPVILDASSSRIELTTAGEVIDNGVDNKITTIN